MVALVWYLATTCRTFKNLPPLTMLCPCRFRLTTRTPVVSVDKPALTPCKFYHDDIAKKKSVSSLSSIFSLFDLIFRDFMSALQNMWWLLETNFYVFADFHFHAFSSPSYCFLPIFLFTIFLSVEMCFVTTQTSVICHPFQWWQFLFKCLESGSIFFSEFLIIYPMNTRLNKTIYFKNHQESRGGWIYALNGLCTYSQNQFV